MTKQELIDKVTILIADWQMGEEPPAHDQNMQRQINNIFERLVAIEAKLEGKKFEDLTNYGCFTPGTYIKDGIIHTPSRPAWIREDGSVDWEKVPSGTNIIVQNHASQDWVYRIFSRLHIYSDLGAVQFETDDGKSWRYAKLA